MHVNCPQHDNKGALDGWGISDTQHDLWIYFNKGEFPVCQWVFIISRSDQDAHDAMHYEHYELLF